MADFLSQFSGAGLASGAKSIRKSTSGVHVLTSVEFTTGKRSGNPTVKFSFDNAVRKGQGVDDYLRTGRAMDLANTLQRLKYVFIHADKNELLARLPVPFSQVTDASGQPVICVNPTKEKMDALKAEYGEDIDTLYADSDRETAIIVRINDAEAYCSAIANLAQELVGTKYNLRINENETGMCDIKQITKFERKS